MAHKNIGMTHPTNTGHMLKNMKLERIFIASVLLLCSLPLYLASDLFWENIMYTRGCVAVSIWGIFGALASKVWLVPKKFTVKTVNLFCTAYWALLVLCWIPYLLGDLRSPVTPAHTLFLGLVLTALPFGGVKAHLFQFGLFGAVALSVCAVNHVGFSYWLQTVFVVAASAFLSVYLAKQQLHLIEKLDSEARTDFLTGIANRTGGMELLKKVRLQARESDQLLAVVLVRVLDFENYIDTFGRKQGDAALEKVATCLKARNKGKYDFIFRYDDDDFVIVQAVPGNIQYVNGFAANCLQDIEDLRIRSSINGDKYLQAVVGVTFATPIDALTDENTLIEQATESVRIAAAKGGPGYHIFEHE